MCVATGHSSASRACSICGRHVATTGRDCADATKEALYMEQLSERVTQNVRRNRPLLGVEGLQHLRQACGNDRERLCRRDQRSSVHGTTLGAGDTKCASQPATPRRRGLAAFAAGMWQRQGEIVPTRPKKLCTWNNSRSG